MGWRAAGVGVGVGVGALLAWWAWRSEYFYPETPTKWEEVGEVSELVIYPLKSGRGVKVTEAEATRYGLARDLLEDRSFVVVTSADTIMFANDKPRLYNLILTLDGSVVTLRAVEEDQEEREVVTFDLDDVIRAAKVINIQKFEETLKGYDCGHEASAWLTRVLRERKQVVRLAYNGDLTLDRQPGRSRMLDPGYAKDYYYAQYKPSDRIVYAQHSAYTLASETSLADLNCRLEGESVTMEWFKPNIVVRGVREAYDEDDWAFVRIGDVVLRRLKPCTKCMFPHIPRVIVPTWSEISRDDRVKRVMLSTRQQKCPEALEYYWKSKPVFGSHLCIDVCGRVRVGDRVSVARTSSNPRWQVAEKRQAKSGAEAKM
ncbi:Mitochondrial amidoxime-reducing component 1 [Chionoecetes opilio]|uniref:Mitochondrial amidoxime-reducing component 1 n=1 Tax=Chionoecetes opilio TaxID=41210 RepID=A0A8J4YQT8_CHIOP|nr:Mitochondrial amidoxime-reducing component 1 [Chionoecetes opilio]